MTAISQTTKKVVILDSIQSQKAIIDLVDCDIKKAELKVTREVLSLNHQVIDKQNEIILNENQQKAALLSTIRERDTIINLQEEKILAQKNTIKKINTPKNIYKFSFYGALVVIGKLLFF